VPTDADSGIKKLRKEILLKRCKREASENKKKTPYKTTLILFTVFYLGQTWMTMQLQYLKEH